MNELELIKRWTAEKPIYQAWADFISTKVHENLADAIAPVALDCFIKVPVKPRLKADSTLVDKALYRKTYANPYEDLTDKVGIRFVVLLTSDIKKVCEVIKAGVGQGWWHASKDRDYEQERLEKPLEFSYQSVHYVLRASENIENNGQIIPEGTPCEVQIRTLLQHAHSELTHDTLYKPRTTAKPEVKRTVAKSMALIETTDEFFEQAIMKLDEAVRPQRELLDFLARCYERGTSIKPGNERSNQVVIDTYCELAPGAPFTEIQNYVTQKSFIFDRIIERHDKEYLFSQSAILLAYYFADKYPAQLKSQWPLCESALKIIFSDLGKKYDD